MLLSLPPRATVSFWPGQRRHCSPPPAVCCPNHVSAQSVDFHYVNWPEEQWVGGACESGPLSRGSCWVLLTAELQQLLGCCCCLLVGRRTAALEVALAMFPPPTRRGPVARPPYRQPRLHTFLLPPKLSDTQLTRVSLPYHSCPQTTRMPPPAHGRCGARPCMLPLAASTGPAPSTPTSGWATSTVSALAACFGL